MGSRRLRGLSPLVATIVLIAMTVVGGVLVYNYFQRSATNIIATGETLVASANSIYLGNNTLLVHVEVTNAYDRPVSIRGISYVDATGSINRASTVNVVVQPGDKATFTVIVPSSAKAIIVDYSIDGNLLQSSPVKLA